MKHASACPWKCNQRPQNAPLRIGWRALGVVLCSPMHTNIHQGAPMHTNVHFTVHFSAHKWTLVHFDACCCVQVSKAVHWCTPQCCLHHPLSLPSFWNKSKGGGAKVAITLMLPMHFSNQSWLMFLAKWAHEWKGRGNLVLSNSLHVPIVKSSIK